MAECAWDVSPQSRWADRGHPYAPVGHTNGMASAPDTCPSCTHAWRLHAVSVRHDGRAHDRRPALSAERGVRKHHDAGHGCDVPRGRQPPPESGEAAGDLRETSPALSLVERPSVPFSGKRHRFFSAIWHGRAGRAALRHESRRRPRAFSSHVAGASIPGRRITSTPSHASRWGAVAGVGLWLATCGLAYRCHPRPPRRSSPAPRVRVQIHRDCPSLGHRQDHSATSPHHHPSTRPRRRQRGNPSALRTELVAETPSGNGQPSAT